MNSAISTPQTVTPASRPPSASLRLRPAATGIVTASSPGVTMRRMAAAVEMSTQRA